MSREVKEYTIWNAVTPQAVTSSTDATPIVVTKATHGYSTGDLVIINGHATNLAANGLYKVTVLSSSTFSLQDVDSGANIAGSGGGAGTGGVVALAPKVIFVQDYRNLVISVQTSGTATLTAKVAGSLGKLASDVVNGTDRPNFGGTQSKSNPYTFVQIIDLDTATAVNGATGITTTGADLQKAYEINVNGQKYITIVPTAWTAGTITIKAQLYSNE